MRRPLRSPRERAAALAWRRRSGGWASLPFRPAAPGRNRGYASVLHCIAVLRMQPGSAGGPAGSLLPPTRHSGAGCGG